MSHASRAALESRPSSRRNARIAVPTSRLDAPIPRLYAAGELGSAFGELATGVALVSDDRVLRSLGLELRPPFPQGYALEQGDWSLLDPVKARPSMWRRTS